MLPFAPFKVFITKLYLQKSHKDGTKTFRISFTWLFLILTSHRTMAHLVKLRNSHWYSTINYRLHLNSTSFFPLMCFSVSGTDPGYHLCLIYTYIIYIINVCAYYVYVNMSTCMYIYIFIMEDFKFI